MVPEVRTRMRTIAGGRTLSNSSFSSWPGWMSSFGRCQLKKVAIASLTLLQLMPASRWFGLFKIVLSFGSLPMKYDPIHPLTYSPCVKSVSYLFHTRNFSASYIPFVAAFDFARSSTHYARINRATDILRVYGPNNIGNFTKNLAFQQAQKTLITSIRGEVAVADTSKKPSVIKRIVIIADTLWIY